VARGSGGAGALIDDAAAADGVAAGRTGGARAAARAPASVKTLFINVWATWCGPCLAEQPHFQKLYERTKDRADVVVFSLNVDDEIGLVEPFLREKGFTFPSLLAASYVSRTLGAVAVPQTWIVDRRGLWLWQQLGYDGDPDWERSMLEKIGSAK